MRNPWSPSLVGALLLFVGLVVGLIVGVWAGMDLVAWERSLGVAEAAPAEPHWLCGDEWIVAPNETVDGIIRLCYPGEHVQAVKERMRPLNPHIKSLGLIYPGDRIRLPERGRR